MSDLFDDLDDFGAFDDVVSGNVRDPYPELAKQRQETPIQRIDMSAMPGEEGKPVFIVYRHEDIQTMLRDNETFSSNAVIQIFGDVLGHGVMLGMDEPVHGRLRSLVTKAFTQKALARWEDEIVGRIGNELIDGFAADGKTDLVKSFTFPYPTRIIAALLGLPEKDFPQFQKWSISMLSFTVNPERGKAASKALIDYFTPILEARRAEPREDLISALAAAEIDGHKLEDEDIYSFIRLLLPAGVETTYRSLGSLLFGLLTNPDQLDAIRADRSLIAQAIEEGVRWDAPLLNITRVTTRDTELGGMQIPQGCSVMPMLGAANRQEDRYPDPDRFDIFRQAKVPISWGHGVHVCLGMHLARLEMRTAINLLLDRLPNLRMDPDGDDPHIRGMVFRSPTSLPALFDPQRNLLTELRFDDRVVIVTGAGRGIGRCHALLLAARGARVVVADNGAGIGGVGSSRTPADDVVREITDAGGVALACHASVTSEEGAGEIVGAALREWGRLDAVVNNAGISDPAPFEDLSVDQFRSMLDVHFYGTLFVIRAAWPHMVQSGYGRIVNTVSEAMLGGLAELSSYGAAKGAVFGLTRNLATEGVAHGIRVNAVAPRAYTRMSAEQSSKVAAQMSFSAELMDQINASMPPDLCSPAAAYLAHESCALNGEILQAGMGNVARMAAVVGSGIYEQAISIEDIADNLDRVMDVQQGRVADATSAQL